jgi:hypothetical protein
MEAGFRAGWVGKIPSFAEISSLQVGSERLTPSFVP